MHLRAIENILGLSRGQTWEEARRELSGEQVAEIHRVFAALWPRETSIADLLPRPNQSVVRAVYVGIVDPRTIPVSVTGWLSYFDEIILANPFMHAENAKPEYSPIVSPSQYKQQTIMNVAVLFQLAPFIHAGRVHLIPDPLQFNDFLRDSVWEMARRKQATMKLEKEDLELGIKMGEDSFRRFMARLPEETLRHQFRKANPNITEEMLTAAIEHLRAEQALDPLALLQPIDDDGEMQGMRGMNFEMGMFLAQLTGAAIYSDQKITRRELDAAKRPAESQQSTPKGDVEQALHLRLSVFRNHEAQSADIARHAEVRIAMRNLWERAVRMGEADDVKELALALDQVRQRSSELSLVGESSGGREDPDAVFDIDVKALVPPNGYALNDVQRFLVSFGRRNRLDSVPLAVLFGKAAS